MKHPSSNDINSIDKQSLQAFNKQIKHLQQQYPRQFSLCFNLSYGINNSIQNPLQLPAQMLSKSIDILHTNNRQCHNYSQQDQIFEQKQEKQIYEQRQNEQKLSMQAPFIKEQQSDHIIMEENSIDKNNQQINLNQLDQLLKKNKFNTKNVLRNFGNAQNQFILYHDIGKRRTAEYLSERNEKEFLDWVRNLKLINFRDYRSVWGGSFKDNAKIRSFKKIYRKICWQFYEVTCIPYIYSGRLNQTNRLTHLKQISTMLKGIQSPQDFNSFRD